MFGAAETPARPTALSQMFTRSRFLSARTQAPRADPGRGPRRRRCPHQHEASRRWIAPRSRRTVLATLPVGSIGCCQSGCPAQPSALMEEVLFPPSRLPPPQTRCTVFAPPQSAAAAEMPSHNTDRQTIDTPLHTAPSLYSSTFLTPLPFLQTGVGPRHVGGGPDPDTPTCRGVSGDVGAPKQTGQVFGLL